MEITRLQRVLLIDGLQAIAMQLTRHAPHVDVQWVPYMPAPHHKETHLPLATSQGVYNGFQGDQENHALFNCFPIHKGKLPESLEQAIVETTPVEPQPGNRRAQIFLHLGKYGFCLPRFP